VLEQLLARLPPQARLRLDANGHWPRPTAAAWAERLAADPRLQWFEQPLAPADQAGLDDLAQRLRADIVRWTAVIDRAGIPKQ
jgi:O-succinylbenzoate synthase